MKKWLLGLTLTQLEEIVKEHSLPSYAAKQIAQWLYQKRVSSIEEMTNLSKLNRELLSQYYQVGGYSPLTRSLSSDGTAKYLFPSLSGSNIEAVMIPDGERATLCLSSQVGCKMGCHFCMTGKMGLKGNLSAGEIISQLFNIEESSSITNVVYMGMGEPLDNYEEVMKSIEILTAEWGLAWSPRRITLSTIGVDPPLRDFLENSQAHLAISLHNPFSDEREKIMPTERRWPIEKTVELIKEFDFSGQRRVSFEYIMFSGLNDSKREADALIRLLRGVHCRVNLIRFHQIPDFPYVSSPQIVMENFRDRLSRAGVITTIRASRGEDIEAACGMLSSSREAGKS